VPTRARHRHRSGIFNWPTARHFFLDEVGELPIELQAKLLRVLEDGTFHRLGNPKTIHVDVRIIAATNRNLKDAIREGKFREDLYHRLNVFPIHMPPLRERREDIPLLVWAFAETLGRRMGKTIKRISHKTMSGYGFSVGASGYDREDRLVCTGNAATAISTKPGTCHWSVTGPASPRTAVPKTVRTVRRMNWCRWPYQTKTLAPLFVCVPLFALSGIREDKSCMNQQFANAEILVYRALRESDPCRAVRLAARDMVTQKVAKHVMFRVFLIELLRFEYSELAAYEFAAELLEVLELLVLWTSDFHPEFPDKWLSGQPFDGKQGAKDILVANRAQDWLRSIVQARTEAGDGGE
jgi:hypothetical protein